MLGMPTARLALTSDLPSLLALFAASAVSRAAEPRETAERVWQETLAQQGVHVFVSDERDRIAAGLRRQTTSGRVSLSTSPAAWIPAEIIRKPPSHPQQGSRFGGCPPQSIPSRLP